VTSEGRGQPPDFAFPKGWTEVRYSVYSYQHKWWALDGYFPTVERAQGRADFLNSLDGCFAVVGSQVVRYDSVQPVTAPARTPSPQIGDTP